MPYYPNLSINVSAGTTSNSLNAVTLANSNGVSFGMSGSVVTATVQTNYLTTAMASGDSTKFVQASANFSGTNVSGTIASNAIQISVGNYLTTAALSGDTSKYAGVGETAGTVAGTDIAITMNTDGLSLAYPKYITTAMQSESSSVFAKTGFTTGSTAGSDIVGTQNTDGLSMGVPKYLTTALASGVSTQFVQANANFSGTNVSGTIGSSAIQISVGNYLTTAALSQDSSKYAGVGETAGTTGGTDIAITMNTDGLSLAYPKYITTAMASGDSTQFVQANANFSGTNISGTIGSSAVQLSVGPYITTAMVSDAGSNFVAASAAFAGTSVSGTIASNGVSVSVGPYITTAALSNETSKYVQNWKLTGNTAGTTSSAQGTDLWISGGANITASGNSNSIVLSVGNYITTAMASGDGTKFVQANANFSGTNVSGTINSSAIQISVGNYLTTAMASDRGSDFVAASAGFAGTSASGTIASNGISISVGPYITTAALSGDTSKYAGTSSGTQSTAGSDIVMTHDTAGLNLGVPKYLTTAAVSGDTSKYVQNWKLTGNTAGTTSSAQGTDLWISGGNNITASGNSNSIVLSVGNYLTTAMASNVSTQFVQANANFSGTNASGTIGSSAIQISVNAGAGIAITAAGGGSASAGTILFAKSDSGNIDFGLFLNSTLTASYGGLSVSAGSLNDTGYLKLIFSNSNGVSFGLSNSVLPLGGHYGIVTASHNGLTTAMASDAGSNFVAASASFAGTSASGTIASNGISVSVGPYLTTAMASGAGSNFVAASASFAGTSASGTIASNAISISIGPYITTAMASDAGSNFVAASASFAGTNASGTIASNAISINVAAGGLSAINIGAGTTSNNVTNFIFQNANGVSFGLGTGTAINGTDLNKITGSFALNVSAGSTSQNVSNLIFPNTNGVSWGIGTGTASNRVSASVNAGLDGWELEGANTAGTTSSAGDTKLYLSGGDGVTLSGNSNTIIINAMPFAMYLEPLPQSNTAGLALDAGSWYFVPFIAPEAMSGGRFNFLHINTSTAGLVRDITASAYATNSRGGMNQSCTYSKAAALYSQGTGSNSTRLESFWSNSFSFKVSEKLSVESLGGTPNLVRATATKSISYIKDIDISGGYVLSQYTTSAAAQGTNTSNASTALDVVGSSIRNMLSDSLMIPIGLNTTITPGAYWLAVAWSTTTASATSGSSLAGGSALIFSEISQIGISRLEWNTAFRNWGSTSVTSRSHMGIDGVYTGAANMAPPQFVAISSDLATVASQWVPWFNYMVRGLTK